MKLPLYEDVSSSEMMGEIISGGIDVEEELMKDETSRRKRKGGGRVGGGGDVVEEEESDGGRGGGGSDDDEGEGMYYGGIRRGPDANLTAPWDLKSLFSMADDETRDRWRLECERVGPALQRATLEMKRGMKGDGHGSITLNAWRSHVATLRHHCNVVDHARWGGDGGDGGNGKGGGGGKGKGKGARGRGGRGRRGSEQQIVSRMLQAPETMPWSVDLASLRRGEPLLESLFARMQQEYQIMLKKELMLSKNVGERRERVHDFSTRLTDIAERCSVVKDEVHRVGADVSDTSPLQVRVVISFFFFLLSFYFFSSFLLSWT